MNVERMREDIYRYCNGRWCKNCVFGDKKSRDKKSGDGTRFLRKDIVDDEEIKKMHKIIFSEKYDFQNQKKVSVTNDLISRKALMQCYEGGNGFDNKASYESIRKMIEYQPTAYDVDAVCDELEKMKEIMLSPINIDCFGDTCRESDCMACILNRAIEIVRNGGKK